MGKTPSNAGRSRGILFVLVLAALILGMGWFFASGILRERSRNTPPEDDTGGGRQGKTATGEATNGPGQQPR